MDDIRSCGEMLITAPSESERLYHMAVRIHRSEFKPLPGYTLHPWISISANVDTGEVKLGAGVTAKKV